MTRRPTLLVLFLLGSEVRQFGHSGVLARLLDEGWRVIVAAAIVDDDLRGQLDARIELAKLPSDRPDFIARELTALLDDANARRMRRHDHVHGWNYVRSAPKNRKQRVLFAVRTALADVISRLPTLVSAAQRWEGVQWSRTPAPGWNALLSETQPDVMLINVPKAGYVGVGLAQADARRIKSVLLYHTWKDVVVASGRLAHRFDRVGVWNAEMSSALVRQNPHFSSQPVAVVGSTHFQTIGDPTVSLEETELRRTLGLPLDGRLLLFTASAPWVVPGEEGYVKFLDDAIREERLPADLRIVVRSNPMDDKGELAARLAVAAPQVCVSRPDWRWDKARNWCFQRFPDQRLYNALLRTAALNVSVPSTVTVECAIADLPIINIGYDPPGSAALNNGVRSYWEADFYRAVVQTEAADFAVTPDALIAKVAAALVNPGAKREQRAALVRAQLGVAPGNSTAAAVKLITTALNG